MDRSNSRGLSTLSYFMRVLVTVVLTALTMYTMNAPGLKPDERATAVLSLVFMTVVALIWTVVSLRNLGRSAARDATQAAERAAQERLRDARSGAAKHTPTPVSRVVETGPKHPPAEPQCVRCTDQVNCRKHCDDCTEEAACTDHCVRCTDSLCCFDHCDDCSDDDPCVDHCEDCTEELNCGQHCDDCDEDNDCEAHVKARVGNGLVTYDVVGGAYVLPHGRKYVAHHYLSDHEEIRFVMRPMRPGELPETLEILDVTEGGDCRVTYHFLIREQAAEAATSSADARVAANGESTEPA